ncbi:28S ribosomal protein S36, mitochondrial-like [Orbicella faveolata]|uniref:28S ribosomal protein S36, mitochondrial-like n=1 Tax=Orbicella faveolata TaxID=48498 RepID=UPI0009E3168E|nr:28S ribosomal protein S36, mitochondrial-like [Orbicella faveolata]
MASATTRVVQQVRKHIPSIRFPNRIKKKTKAGPSDRTLEISSILSAISKRTLPAASAARPTTISSSSAAFNSDDLHSYHTLPARYRRRPLTQDEMEYIERGGPE